MNNKQRDKQKKNSSTYLAVAMIFSQRSDRLKTEYQQAGRYDNDYEERDGKRPLSGVFVPHALCL